MAKQLGDLVATLFHQSHDWKIALLSAWPDIVGPLASKVQVEKIMEDTLVVAVKDSCWLQELYLLTPVLLKTINKTLDQPRIKNLRFKIADSSVKEIKKRENVVQQPVPKKIYLSPAEQATLEKISDKELRQALRQFLVRCYQER